MSCVQSQVKAGAPRAKHFVSTLGMGFHVATGALLSGAGRLTH